MTYCRKDITPKQRERLVDAEDRGNRALADGNEALESGNRVKAQKLFGRAQHWLDVANELRGMGE